MQEKYGAKAVKKDSVKLTPELSKYLSRQTKNEFGKKSSKKKSK